MHLFRIFAREAQRLLAGARIEKIQEAAAGVLLLGLYSEGKKRQLCIRISRQNPFCFFSDDRITAVKKPSASIMRLRKYFGDKKIASAVFRYAARQIWLLAGPASSDGKACWLNLDLANGPEIRFLANDDFPKPEELAWPDANSLPQALENWRDWPVLSPPLRKTLKALDPMEGAALLADLEDGSGDLFLYSERDSSGASKISKVSAWPFPASQAANLTECAREDVLPAFCEAGQNLVLAPLHEKALQEALRPAKRRIRQLEKLLEKLETDKSRLQAMADQGKWAELIKENLWKLEAAGAGQSEICLTDVSGHEARIPLDSRFSAQENMERYFHAATRGKRGLKMLEQRRRSLAEELSQLGRDPHAERETAIKSSPAKTSPITSSAPKGIDVFTSSDGFRIMRGKNSKGNQLVRKLAAGHDLWGHVLTGPGAHVVICRAHSGAPVPETTMAEAASLAMNKSWLKDAQTAEVVFAEIRHVKPNRKAPPGEVVYDKVFASRIARRDQEIEERLQKAPV